MYLRPTEKRILQGALIPPTDLSLLVLTKNAGPQVCRALDSLAGQPAEVILVDTGSDDGSSVIIEDHWARRWPDRRLVWVHHNFESDPQSFLLDSPRTFSGGPVDLTQVEALKEGGAFSHRPFLADFGAARRAGWAECSRKFATYLDSDDVWLGTSYLPEVLEVMDRESLAVAGLPYDYRRDEEGQPCLELWPARVVRHEGSRWEGRMHETLEHEGKSAFLRGFGGVRDENDLKDPGSRVLLRGWKALYYQYVTGDHSERTRFMLALESRGVAPDFALKLFDEVAAQGAKWPARVAKCFYESGLICERAGRLDKAESYYRSAALTCEKETDALYSLARLAHSRGDYASCIDLTEQASERERKRGTPAVLQHDPRVGAVADRLYRDSARRLAAAARETNIRI